MAEPFWNVLFAAGEASEERPMRLVRKSGLPFLLLPCKGKLAARCLDLYPAQTNKAKLAKGLFKNSLRLGLPTRAEVVTLKLNAKSEFATFLRSVSNFHRDQIPDFGILAGNPAADTQRFVILLLDQHGAPAAVVKAGTSKSAQELVEKESAFLASAQGNIGVPKLLQTFSSNTIQALALPYISGNAPLIFDQKGLAQILGSWVNSREKIALRDTAGWRALSSRRDAQPELDLLKPSLEGKSVQATLSHGDFAPWNVKVLPNGDWIALDWERGNLRGIPAWDWFHFLIQSGILVKKLHTPQLADALENLIASPEFAPYAIATGIQGLEKDLCQVYLLHMVQVVRPAQGLEANRHLLELLTGRWRR
jgi:hypothetical protein